MHLKEYNASMGERTPTGDPTVLEESRNKAETCLKEGRTFALGHAMDLKLGLSPAGFELAVSFSASQLLKDDIFGTQKLMRKIHGIPFSGFVEKRFERDLRALELAEDYLGRTRDELVREQLSDRPEEYALTVRQAVQNLFVLERGKNSMSKDQYNEQVGNWGTHWKTQIQQIPQVTYTQQHQ